MGGRLRIGYFVDTFFPMVDGVIMAVDNYARRLSAVADVTGGGAGASAMPAPCRSLSNLVVCGEMSLES